MPLDASAQSVISLLAAAGGQPLEELSPADARALFAGVALLAGEGAAVAGVDDRSVAGVPCKVVTPDGDGPFPTLVWIHGGGWVIGSAAESLATARNLAAKANCVVVSVDYRLAPEHKAPAAMDDCTAVIEAILADPPSFDSTGRVAVGGDSAGGNLSALCGLHFGQRLAGQVLIYPATNLTMGSPSIEENAEGYMLTKKGMIWFGENYLADSGIEPDDPRVSPLFASDEAFAGASPALVVTAGYDPLRDEGEAFAAKLTSAGVPVTAKRFDGQIHGFYSMPLAIPEASVAEDLTASFLAGVFA